jgi:ribonuclease HI
MLPKFLQIRAIALACQMPVEMNIKQIQVYGDSSLVIQWMKGTGQILNISLRPIGDQFKEMVSLIDFISFTHV